MKGHSCLGGNLWQDFIYDYTHSYAWQRDL